MLIPHAPLYARRFLLLVQFLVAYKTTMPAKLIEFHHPRKPLTPPQVTPVDLGSVRVSTTLLPSRRTCAHPYRGGRLRERMKDAE